MTDQAYLSAVNAWNNQRIKETKGSGKHLKPKYENFKEFFDYKTEFEAVFTGKRKERTENSKMADVNRLMNEYFEKKGGS